MRATPSRGAVRSRAATKPRQPKRLPRDARRETILRAAADVIGRRGYAAASMDEVAAAAGVTKLILYRHFASKAELHRATLKRIAGQVCDGFAAGLEEGGFGVGTRSLLTVARAEPVAFRLFWRQADHPPEFARDAATLRRRAIAAARLRLGDRVPKASREWAAHALVGYLVEAVLNWLAFGDPARDEQFVRATDKALRAGVRAWTEMPGG